MDVRRPYESGDFRSRPTSAPGLEGSGRFRLGLCGHDLLRTCRFVVAEQLRRHTSKRPQLLRSPVPCSRDEPSFASASASQRRGGNCMDNSILDDHKQGQRIKPDRAIFVAKMPTENLTAGNAFAGRGAQERRSNIRRAEFR